jgi:hypothetical protein
VNYLAKLKVSLSISLTSPRQIIGKVGHALDKVRSDWLLGV